MQQYFKRHYLTPFVLPIIAFLLAILIGGTLLSLEAFSANKPVSIVDAFFVATSAVCVTGLSPIDVFSEFTIAGQWIIIALMQLGCLGIITYTTLIFYIIGKNISLRDRLAVQQSIVCSNVFSLRKFIKRIVFFVFAFECTSRFTYGRSGYSSRQIVVFPDCRGPVRVITGKKSKHRFISSDNDLYISSLLCIWTNLKCKFKIVQRYSFF